MNDARNTAAPGPAVLVVDDNVDACVAMTLLLGAHGYRVESANDAGSAITTALAMAPAAVLMDLNLPDGHGVEVMDRLRDEPWADRCLFIAVSGDEDAGELASEAGFAHVMVKPVDLELLLERLASVVS